MLVVVSYDIPDDRRRLRLAKVLEGYGERVQYSVFECNLTARQYDELRKEVVEVINNREDSVRVYHLCRACRESVEVIGCGEVAQEERFFIV